MLKFSAVLYDALRTLSLCECRADGQGGSETVREALLPEDNVPVNKSAESQGRGRQGTMVTLPLASERSAGKCKAFGLVFSCCFCRSELELHVHIWNGFSAGSADASGVGGGLPKGWAALLGLLCAAPGRQQAQRREHA